MRDAEECYRLGVSRYPEIPWAWPDFERAFRERARSNEAGVPSEDEFVRLACLEERPEGLAVLERDYIRPLRAGVRSICVTEHDTESAMQELLRKLLAPPSPRLQSFRPSGNFRAWLKVVATRTALDAVRHKAAHARREVALEERLEELATGPEERFLHEEQRAVLRSALRAAVKRLPKEQQYALRMHVTAGWNIGQIGRALSVHRATVARWLVAAKDALRDMVREELARLAGPHGAEALALESLPSRLDLSLSRVFATTGVYVCA